MRIAVASQNFRTITGHAGKTRRFLVYEVTAGQQAVEVERLDLPKEMAMHEFHGDGPHPLDAMTAVISAGAGEGFADRMAERGIYAAVAEEEIAPAKAASDLAEAIVEALSAAGMRLEDLDGCGCGCDGHGQEGCDGQGGCGGHDHDHDHGHSHGAGGCGCGGGAQGRGAGRRAGGCGCGGHDHHDHDHAHAHDHDHAHPHDHAGADVPALRDRPRRGGGGCRGGSCRH